MALALDWDGTPSYQRLRALADGVAAGVGQCTDEQPVAVGAEILEQRWRFEEIDDDYFFGTVIVQVAYGNPSRGVFETKPDAC